MQSNNDENHSNLDLAPTPKLCIESTSNIIDVITLLKQYNRSQIDKILCTQTVSGESTSDFNIQHDNTQRGSHSEKVNTNFRLIASTNFFGGQSRVYLKFQFHLNSLFDSI